MKLKKLFVTINRFIIILLTILGVLAFLMFQNKIKLDEKHEIRCESQAIAGELQKSSDKLTEYCRNYVSTGDSVWEKKYWGVLEVRNGKKASPDGETISLQNKMRKLGFTVTEFDKLNEAEQNSNDLVYTEMVAFHAMKGLFDDGTGDFSIKKNPDTLLARTIMYNEKYHADKAKIMNPIADFFIMQDARTQQIIKKHKRISCLLFGTIIIIIVIIIIISSNSFFVIKRKIVDQLKEVAKSKEKTEESEAKFRQLSNLTFEGIIIYEKGIAIDVNLSFARMFGYKPEELINKKIISILFPKEYHAIISENVIKKYALPYEVEGVRKNGSIFPVEIEAREILSDKNNHRRVSAVRNITRRKKREAEIKKLSIAVEQSANTIVLTDIEGNIEYTNPKFTQRTGYTAKEALGQNPKILSTGTQPKEYYTEMWKTISEGKIWKGEFHNKSKGGTFFWEQVTITPIKDDKGKIINYLAIKEDFTARREAEQKLINSEQKLRELNATKDKFFSIIAHDLKSPFNSILGFSELLIQNFDTYDTQKQKKMIGIIQKGMLNTHKLLENLLLWSLSQRGNIDFNPEKENLYLLTEETIKLVKQSAINKSINLKNNISENIIVKADKNMLLTIVRNLISNALKFTPQRGIVTIKTASILTKNKQKFIEISVLDNGVGIESKMQTKLFDISENTSTQGTENEAGTGLGLILCKEFVEKHGGEIWVESEVGKGSEFIFTLPVSSA